MAAQRRQRRVARGQGGEDEGSGAEEDSGSGVHGVRGANRELATLAVMADDADARRARITEEPEPVQTQS